MTAAVLLCLAMLMPVAARASVPTSISLAIATPAGAAANEGAVILTATVTAAGSSASVQPGVVNFCDAGTSCTQMHLIGTATLSSGGTAAIRTVPGDGTRTYQAMFVGAPGYRPSTSNVAMLGAAAGGKLATTTTISDVSLANFYYAVLKATVKGVDAPANSPAPTGTVTYVDTNNDNNCFFEPSPLTPQNPRPAPKLVCNACPLSPATQLSGGAATVNVTTPAGLPSPPAGESTPNVHNVVAEYSGDSNYDPSVSSPYALHTQPMATGLTLTVSPPRPTVGGAVTLTATVTLPHPAQESWECYSLAGESMVFSITNTPNPTTIIVPLNSANTATVNITLSPGEPLVNATYQGDSHFGGFSVGQYVSVPY